MSLRHALVTDCGRERDNNEDSARAVEPLGLFVIADGMGGHAGGEVASRVAVETFVTFVEAHGAVANTAESARILSEALLEADTAVWHEASQRDLAGMGTTLTALQIQGDRATICHIGDTRASFLRNGALENLTQDHTLVGLMVEGGVIPAEDAKNHPDRHVLTQALGTGEAIEPDLLQLRIPSSTRIVLSTDGLHDVLSQAELAELATSPDLEDAARSLVDRANEQGGPDNITVILIDP